MRLSKQQRDNLTEDAIAMFILFVGIPALCAVVQYVLG